MALVDHPNVRAALARANLLPPSGDLAERLASACDHPEVDPDGILEITRAGWGTEEQGADDTLVVQTRTRVFVVVKHKGGLLRPASLTRVRYRYEDFADVVEDDTMAGTSVAFLARPGHDHFLLSFARTAERDRMFRCLFEAHAGLFARWGLQLDPAHYVADFDRYHAELVAKGPDDADDWWAWVAHAYGEFDPMNALGFAAEWRRAQLDEQSGRSPNARFGQLAATAMARVERCPEARPLILRLGAELFDDGALGPPYDERTFPDDPISHHDAGPKRLLLLMTLAGLARADGHPRTDEWIAAARTGLPAIPGAVFTDDVRALWADIEALPPAEPPRDLAIWEDVDVRAITTGDGPDVVYSLDMLDRADRTLVTGFLEAYAASERPDVPEASALLHTCLVGVAAFEDLSPGAAAGWRKFLVYSISDIAYDLWHDHRLAEPAGRLAQWVVVTIEGNGWGPDGRATPLGQHHSFAMGVAAASGIGIVEIDPETGRASVPTGEAARAAARVGHF